MPFGKKQQEGRGAGSRRGAHQQSQLLRLQGCESEAEWGEALEVSWESPHPAPLLLCGLKPTSNHFSKTQVGPQPTAHGHTKGLLAMPLTKVRLRPAGGCPAPTEKAGPGVPAPTSK